MGAKAAEEIRPDLAFLQEYPHRCPTAVEAFHREAKTLDGLIDRLSLGGAGRGLKAFVEGAAETGPVIEERFNLSYPRRSRRESPRAEEVNSVLSLNE